MQFQVPQFIETEDKIVGPLTIRQFIYLVIAGGFGFLLWFTLEFWVAIIFIFFIGGIAFALAFIRIQGRPLVHVIGASFWFYWKPHTYVWQPEHPDIELASPAKPRAPKLSLEKIVAGMTLKNAWHNLQTGTKKPPKPKPEKPIDVKERYEIFQKVVSGERRAARRVDYR